jgi:hypothetical protein
MLEPVQGEHRENDAGHPSADHRRKPEADLAEAGDPARLIVADADVTGPDCAQEIRPINDA